MHTIRKKPIHQLGYDFVKKKGTNGKNDEYHIRNIQNKRIHSYRNLTAKEIETLVHNRNTADDWNNIRVSEIFNPNLVVNCHFFGLVRIGNLEPYALEHHNLLMPVGIYNSTIISCDFGNNIVVENVNYMSHYIVEDEVMLVNINELVTTPSAKFGNGMIKKGEGESKRIFIELCNENGGRSIIPFEGILPGDAYLWSRYRSDKKLQSRLVEFTDKRFDPTPGYYGTIGSHTVIKNTKMIKDAKIGSSVYIKGANKIKNITIRSSAEAPSQIGEGCELVNGIIGFGCRIFYGVKAVRFIMASHSQLKYGARLINSFLGNNATISCCEVLNSLIFPGHEQHHNNSFLCASLVKGQSNMAAGATIGSNHNSRAADGELIAGRGFWPGLCVSLKHNSNFASFVLVAKGNYPAELNITIPFSLVSNDEKNNRLVIMPAYWFIHNMYALARNCQKSYARDQRLKKRQMLHYQFLEPDSVSEMVCAIRDFEYWAGKIFSNQSQNIDSIRAEGRRILSHHPEVIQGQEVLSFGLENSTRPVVIRKIYEAYHIFKKLIRYNVVVSALNFLNIQNKKSIEQLHNTLSDSFPLEKWENIGGQLIPQTSINRLKKDIISGTINTWDDIHQFYTMEAKNYPKNRLIHAVAAYEKVFHITLKGHPEKWQELLEESIDTKKWINQSIYESRAKDYNNAFRSLTFESKEEMEVVTGKLEENAFILESQEECNHFIKEVGLCLEMWKEVGV